MPIRAIVCGAGAISNAWFPPLRAEGVEVAAVVDLQLDRAAAQIEKHQVAGAIAERDLPAALRNHRADFLIDLTIPAAHRDVTIAALEAGLHVIGEKPMAESLADARQMIAASEKSKKLYMVSQSRRWDVNHFAVAAARENVVGEFGEAYCDFFVGPHFGGFREQMRHVLILDMAIHQFDLARMFLGVDATAVYAESFNPAGSWFAHGASANALFEMENGKRFAFTGSWADLGMPTSWNGHWRFRGPRGTIVYERDQPPTAEIAADPGKPAFTWPTEKRTLDVPPLKRTGMHGALGEMLAFLRDGTVPQTECRRNFNSLAMVAAAIESAETGRRVAVERL